MLSTTTEYFVYYRNIASMLFENLSQAHSPVKSYPTNKGTTVEMFLVEVIANALSTFIILSCLFLKVPQILSIKERQSADGIYVKALAMEISGFSIMALYSYTNNYSIMTYLEYPIILVQVYVMMYYVLKFKKMQHLPIVPIAAALYVMVVLGFALEVFPKEILSYLVPFCTPLSGFAKVSYIYGMVSASDAGATSLTTWTISVVTNLVRLFTVYVDSADLKLLINFLISTFLSFGVLVTAKFYKDHYEGPPQPSPRRRRIASKGRIRDHDE